jgi:ABC-type phosphate transport system auxiliary subunit
MEFLYFMGGIIVVGVIYGGFLLNHVKSSYKTIIQQNQSILNHSTVKYADIQQEIADTISFVNDIKEKMAKDQYTQVSELNKEFTLLKETNEKQYHTFNFATKNMDKTTSTIVSEIQQLKSNIKALGADPNMLNRY